jgi:hypothetical protein
MDIHKNKEKDTKINNKLIIVPRKNKFSINRRKK